MIREDWATGFWKIQVWVAVGQIVQSTLAWAERDETVNAAAAALLATTYERVELDYRLVDTVSKMGNLAAVCDVTYTCINQSGKPLKMVYLYSEEHFHASFGKRVFAADGSRLPVLDSSIAVAALALAAVRVARDIQTTALEEGSARPDGDKQDSELWGLISGGDVPIIGDGVRDNLRKAIVGLNDMLGQGDEDLAFDNARLRTYIGLVTVLHCLRALLDGAPPQIAALPAPLSPIRGVGLVQQVIVTASNTVPMMLPELQRVELKKLRDELPGVHSRLLRRFRLRQLRRRLGSFLVPHSRVEVLVPLPRLAKSLHVRCIPPAGATIKPERMRHWLHVVPRVPRDRSWFWTSQRFKLPVDLKGSGSARVEAPVSDRLDGSENDSQAQLIFGNQTVSNWRNRILQDLESSGGMDVPSALEFNRARYEFAVKGPLVYFSVAWIAGEAAGLGLALLLHGYRVIDAHGFLADLATPLAVFALLVALRGTTGPWLGGKLMRFALGWFGTSLLIGAVMGYVVNYAGRALSLW